jgi:hypothetical protein
MANPALTEAQVPFLLSVRGLLAQGILQHCLEKRHRVNYGVCRYLAYAAMQVQLITLSCQLSCYACCMFLH